MTRRLPGYVFVGIVVSALALDASSPKFFQAATQADFLKGEVENLSIDGRNQLSLAQATELVYETASPFLWSLAPAADGSLYLGAGNDGKVFKVDAQGTGTSVFSAGELEVHAVAAAPDGGLYVGTSPGGKIYKLDRSGAATTFFEPQEKYIWALAVDPKGTVYAATGDKGVVYKIAPDGKGAVFYRTKATHATALALDKSGALFVGTESPGRVLKVDADGKAFLVLDSPFQEIRTLRFDDKGVLYVAAVNGRPGAEGGPPVLDTAPAPADAARPPVASVSTEITAVSVAVVDTPGSGATTASTAGSARGGPKGAIYRITPDGVWDEVWASRDDSPYDVLVEGDGRLIVGTGSKGKLYRLEGNPVQATLLARAGAQQITALYKDPKGRIYYATANPGKLFRLSSGLATEGQYESESRDAQMVATWGAISWRGQSPPDSRIEVFTRSGNTEAPDETWSPWSAAYTVSEGSPITSPKARYLQWKAKLSGKGQSPVLTSVTAAYLQRNIRPEVQSVTVHPPGIVFQKPYSTGDPDLAGFENQTTPDRKLSTSASAPQSATSPSLGRRTYEKGLQTLIWRATDQNEDELSYDVEYRREGEPAWTILRRDVTESILVWDTTTVPNGTYFVKIVASDIRSNVAATALAGELESSSFKIDNTPPTISLLRTAAESGKLAVTFDVADADSPIQRVEYSTDGQIWKSVFPLDGIADSKLEHYQLAVELVSGGRVRLRASDAMNNVVTLEVNPQRR